MKNNLDWYDAINKVKYGFSYLHGENMMKAYPIGFQFKEGYWGIRVEDFDNLQFMNAVAFKNKVIGLFEEKNKRLCYNRADLIFNGEYVFLVDLRRDEHYIYIMGIMRRRKTPEAMEACTVCSETLQGTLHLPSDINRLMPIDPASVIRKISPRQAESNLEWALLNFAV